MTSRKPASPYLCWPGKSSAVRRDVDVLVLEELFGPDGDPVEGPSADCLPWRDLLVRADNRRLLSSLANGPLRRLIDDAGGIKLVYMDPPFAVGADFSAPAGGSAVKALAYRDTWSGGLPAFLDMMHERLLLLREVLALDGSLYLHCDYRTAAHMRLLLDEVFGPERFLGDIVWHYTGGGRAKRWFSRKHDRILHYARSERWTFNTDAVRVPYKPTSGYARSGIVSRNGKRYLPHPDGTPADDVWDIPMINPMSPERNGYPTQKPEALLERVILASSNPGDLIADCFCGSGTTAAVARRLGRRWLAVDDSALAVHTARKRLLLPDGEPGAGARFVTARMSADAKAAPPEKAGTEDGEAGSHGVFVHETLLEGGRFRYSLSDIHLLPGVRGDSFIVELAGFTVRLLEDGGTAAAGIVPEDWRDWLDYWSVGLPCPGLPVWPGSRAGAWCNGILWHSARGKKRAPLFRTPELVWPGGKRYADGRRTLLVTVIDIFANASRITLSL